MAPFTTHSWSHGYMVTWYVRLPLGSSNNFQLSQVVQSQCRRPSAVSLGLRDHRLVYMDLLHATQVVAVHTAGSSHHVATHAHSMQTNTGHRHGPLLLVLFLRLLEDGADDT